MSTSIDQLARDALELRRVRKECEKLEHQLLEARRELYELRDCALAAACGDIELAEAYVAGGVLGIRHLEGDWIGALEITMLPAGKTAMVACGPQDLLVLRRLWVDPECAPHFSLRNLLVGNLSVLYAGSGPEIPCQLFATRYGYGSPLLHEVVEVGLQISVTVTNTSDKTQDFFGAALGYTARMRQE